MANRTSPACYRSLKSLYVTKFRHEHEYRPDALYCFVMWVTKKQTNKEIKYRLLDKKERQLNDFILYGTGKGWI